MLHGGTQLALSAVRETHWLINGRRAAKKFISSCIPYIHFRTPVVTQRMSDLPASRVIRLHIFAHVGIDYAGPVKARMSSGRGCKSFPGYIAVVVCMSTRAVYLEFISRYDTEHFMAESKRIISRRGLCTDVYFDCGTNFVGPDSALKAMFSEGSSHVQHIIHELSNQGIAWHFNLPSAPNFENIWESAVKSTKFYLKRVIGDSTLTFKEMLSLLCCIESCLNSRPLCPLTDDPFDFSSFTPGHLITWAPSEVHKC